MSARKERRVGAREVKANTYNVVQIGVWGRTASTPALVFISLHHQTGSPLPTLEETDDGLGVDYNRVGDFKALASAVLGGQDLAIRMTLKMKSASKD